MYIEMPEKEYAALHAEVSKLMVPYILDKTLKLEVEELYTDNISLALHFNNNATNVSYVVEGKDGIYALEKGSYITIKNIVEILEKDDIDTLPTLIIASTLYDVFEERSGLGLASLKFLAREKLIEKSYSVWSKSTRYYLPSAEDYKQSDCINRQITAMGKAIFCDDERLDVEKAAALITKYFFLCFEKKTITYQRMSKETLQAAHKATNKKLADALNSMFDRVEPKAPKGE